MEFVARPYLAAGILLAAAGMVAATSAVTPFLPEVQVREFQLTTSQDVLDAQLEFNSSLINGFLDSNHSLVVAQQDQVESIASFLVPSPANIHVFHLGEDAVDQFFDANNALTGADQAALLGLLGARGTVDDGGFTPLDLADLNESLLVDPRHAGSIPFAGLESAIGHYIGAAVFLSGALNGATGDDVDASAGAESFAKLVADLSNFNDAQLDAEHAFDTDLVTREVDLEQAMFGTDSAYNGVINRAFNAFNMMFDAQQLGFNGLLGLTDYNPQEYTDALLTGSSDQLFNDGSIGGLTGMFDQLLMMLAEAADPAGVSGIPNGFTADPDAVKDAFDALMSTLGSGPFGDVFASGGAFSDLLVDLQSMFADAFGAG